MISQISWFLKCIDFQKSISFQKKYWFPDCPVLAVTTPFTSKLASILFTSRIHIFILNIWFGFSFFCNDKKFPIPVTCYNSRNLLNQLTALLFQELEHIRIDTLFCHDSRKCLVWKPGFVLWCCLLIHRGRCWRLH